MASTEHFNGKSLVAREATRDCKLSLKKNLQAMHNIASERVINNTNKAPHDDPDPEPIRLSQRIILRSGTPVPAAVLARLHSLYKNNSAVATELLTTVMEGDETHPMNIYYRFVIRQLFEEKLKAEAQLAGVFPTDLDLPLLTQELFERFFATFGVPQGTNLELLGEAGNVDDDVLETWFTGKYARFRSCFHAAMQARQAKRACRRHWDNSVNSKTETLKKSLLRH